MNLMYLNEMEEQLKKELDNARYRHTIGVSYTAASLAMRYESNVQKAQIAGLLHDCAKCIPDSQKIQICESESIDITDFERENPFLIHSKLGAFLANTIYGVNDNEILNSITYHTTGRPDMSLLEKIIYIADYIEPLRDKAPNLMQVRKMAFIDIDRCLCMILEDCLIYLKRNGRNNIDPMTQNAYEYYIKVIEGDDNE